MVATNKRWPWPHNTWQKLGAADYFLQMMEKDLNLTPFIFNLDAFLVEFRATTLVMQKELNRYPGFEEWYATQRAWMENDSQMKMLCELRNFAVHRGFAPRFEVAVSEPINLDIKEVATITVYDEEGNLKEQKQFSADQETPKPPREGPGFELKWYFDKTPELEKKLHMFSAQEIDNVLKTDVVTICKTCLGKLQPVILDYLREWPT